LKKKNKKIQENLRTHEAFLIKSFQECNKDKISFFLKSDKNWENLKKEILKEKEVTYILKEGFRLNPDLILSYAAEDKKEELFKFFYITNKLLKKACNNDPIFLELVKEEKFYIDQLLIMHYPIIVKLVSKTCKTAYLRSYWMELYNEGILGLIHGMHKYNFNFKTKFITYGYKWIQYYIHRELNKIINKVQFEKGTYNKYLFKNKILSSDISFDDFIKNIENKVYEIDLNELLKDRYKENENFLMKEINDLMTNNKKRRDFLYNLKSEQSRKFLAYNIDHKITIRLILETQFPFLTSNLSTDSYEEDDIIYESTIENCNENIEHNLMIKSLITQAKLTEHEEEEINLFLKDDSKATNINKLILKIKTIIKENKIESCF
jgi:hypothetical protein